MRIIGLIAALPPKAAIFANRCLICAGAKTNVCRLNANKHCRYHEFLAVCLLALAGLFPAYTLAQTPTDTTFGWNTFNQSHILPHKPEPENVVYAAGRLAANPDEIPTQTYVVTRQEILLNGFVSLVDVLKTIPGFRTSQPGSTELGDTFIMRGMLGNTYTKILINGVPIRPSAVPGMPLGSQLPILQAERIEIILGPASSLYGTEALAGVINIVMPEVNRPIEAMASISLGTGSEEVINLSLGGKLGKNKHVLNYRFYASNSEVFDLDLFRDPAQYAVDSNVTNRPGYIGAGTDPELRELPHQSQLLGLHLQYGALSLQLQTMSRSDHSSLGSHPTHVAGHNSLTYYADNVQTASLQYSKNLNKYVAINSILSTVGYEIDRNSAFDGVAHPISNGHNFMYAESQDFMAEQLVSYSRDNLSIVGGGSVRYYGGIPLIQYLSNPWDADRLVEDEDGEFHVLLDNDSLSRIDSITPLDEYSYLDYALFAQGSYKLGNLNLVAGLRWDIPNSFASELSPKLGFNYKVNDKLRFRGLFARAFSVPSPYFEYNNYVVPEEELGPGGFSYHRTFIELSAESITNYEIGAMYKVSKALRLEARYFTHRLANSIFPIVETPAILGQMGGGPGGPGGGPDDDLIDDTPDLIVGYNNFNSLSVLHGAEITGQYNTEKLNITGGIHWYHGTESIDSISNSIAYRYVPDYLASLNVRVNLPSNIRLGINARYVGNFSDQVSFFDGVLREQPVAAFYNIDVVTSKTFGKHFTGLIRVNNIFNSTNRGIQTNWLTSNGLDYMPQLNRIGYLSLIYNLD